MTAALPALNSSMAETSVFLPEIRSLERPASLWSNAFAGENTVLVVASDARSAGRLRERLLAAREGRKGKSKVKGQKSRAEAAPQRHY